MFKRLIFSLFVLLSITSLNAGIFEGIFGDNTNSNTMTSQEDKVVINDTPLSWKISIDGSTTRFVYDLLDARVTITNKSDSQYELEYRFIWYDESGFELGKHLSKWKHVRIDAKDTISLKALAVTPKVDSFKFYLRDRQ